MLQPITCSICINGSWNSNSLVLMWFLFAYEHHHGHCGQHRAARFEAADAETMAAAAHVETLRSVCLLR